MKLRTALWPALVALTLCLLLSSTMVGAGLEDGTQSTDETVGFADSEIVEQRGDVATIQLELANTNAAALQVQSAQQDYKVTLQARDEDGDGTVRIQFNTFTGLDGADGSAFTAAGDDSVVVHEQSTTQSLPVLDSGRYNLIASTESSRISNVLRLEDATIGESKSAAVAPDANATSIATVESTDREGASTTTVARGDTGRAEFTVSGIEGLLREPAPSDRLVFANDSQPKAETTHHLRLSPDRDIENVQTISIDYGESGSAIPNVQGLSWDDIETLGVDSNDDGHIDRFLGSSVAGIRTTSDGEITIRFDDTVSVSESETLFAAYEATNPNETGTADVHVRFDSNRYVERGAIGYGNANQGTLGHGVDLRVQSNADQAPAMTVTDSVTTTYDSTTDTLVANVETENLDPGTYSVVLRIDEESPLAHKQTTLSEQFTISPPAADLSESELTAESTLTVSATTNLAPTNPVTIQVRTDPLEGGYLTECRTTVERDGAISCDMDVPETDTPVMISLNQNGSQITEPIRYEFSPPERTTPNRIDQQ